MPFGIQPLHLVIILIVAVIIFGPDKLPAIGRGLGKALNEFRHAVQDMSEGFHDEFSGKSVSAAAPQPLTHQPAPNGYCTQCGTPRIAYARFCHRCGALLDAGANLHAAEVQPQAEDAEALSPVGAQNEASTASQDSQVLIT